jgi:NAD(P)-dependent dehydrogenase (short-subunit alcohol dehydrogenase family)
MTGWWEARAGLAGTVAVVTGGAGGLGEAITRDLVANGVRVAVLDIDGEASERLGLELGDDVLVRHGDVRDSQDLEALFAAADDRWGRLDILVNVPGGTFQAPFTETRPKGWDALIRMNLTHVLQACSLAVPRMRAGGRGGRIVNLTTIECHRAAPNYAVYSAAKAGVEQFARSLAVEVAPDNIRVNNVAPDYTPTPGMARIAETSDPEVDSRHRISIPMRRAGVPTDVSSCVVFLASELSAYVTGQTLHPDGGAHASSGWFNWPGHGWRNSVPEEVSRLLSDR